MPSRITSYLIYPVIAGGAFVTLIALIGGGHAYWRVAPFVMLVTAVLIVALERRRPHATAWQRDQGDLHTDLIHLGANVAVSQGAMLAYTAVDRAGWLGHVWAVSAPFWLQSLLALAIIDLALYAIHRASHGAGWLWRLHAIHHSPRRVYWINGQRRHLLHELIEGGPGLIVLGLFGAPAAAVGCASAAVTIHLMFQHGNIDYRAGWLRHVFAVAELHRWHHQRRWREVQGNYGAVFSIWDRVLGTSLPQRGGAPLDVGMDDEPDLPPDWPGQMTWPFRRRRAVAEVSR